MVLNTPSSKLPLPPLTTNAEDESSPSNYLKTRKSRSHSMSLPQKPSIVAQAIAAKAEMRSRMNDNLSTPTRLVTRRSSFSSSTPSGGAGAAAGIARRSIYGSNKSPIRPSKSPNKNTSISRRSMATTAPPGLLKPTSTQTNIKLRTSTCDPGRPSKMGPIRATIPVKCVAPLKRETPRPPNIVVSAPSGSPRPTPSRNRPSMGGAYGSATPGAAKRIPMASPAPSAAARRRTVSDANVPISQLPRPNTIGLKRVSFIRFLCF